MDLFEYQAKELFSTHGVPVLDGIVVTTPEEAEAAAAELLAGGGDLVVVKAQVKTGGRGKAGGVKLAHSAAEARDRAADILGMDIKGHIVHSLLIASGADISEEYYFSILLDRSNRQHLAMCSREGGMEIEKLAVERPDALVRFPLDPDRGIDEGTAAEILALAGFEEGPRSEMIVPVLQRLWETYRDEDATLVEVNPLVATTSGEILALDGKMTLDDNAAFRHPDHARFRDTAAEDPREAMAKAAGLNYVRLEGQVGIIGNGAGLVMSTLDVVALAGEDFEVAPANFLDIGGGASAEVMAKGLEVVLGDEQVRSVLVNVFGGITAGDQVAEGIVGALELLGDRATKPLVVRLDGNRMEEGRRILSDAAHPLVHMADTMDGAARLAAELAADDSAAATSASVSA